MLFYYDRISGKTGVEQFRNYLDNEIYLSELKRDTKDLVNYQLIEVRRAIQEGSSGTKAVIENLTGTVCGTLENGLNAIIAGVSNTNWYLNEANEKLNDIYLLLDWKTDLIIEEQKITNYYLGNIERLLNKPEQLKTSCYHLEQGMAFLISAIEEGPNSALYVEAKDEFLEAYKDDQKNFICLKMLGIVYYYLGQPIQGIPFLADASKYALVFSKTVSSNFNKTYLHAFTKDKLLQEAASSLDYAARCCYILNRLSDCIVFIKQAIQIQPNNLEFQFLLAKYLSANGEIENAVNVLEGLIEKNENFSIKLLIEQDLATKESVSAMIERLRSELERKISNVIQELNSIKKHLDREHKSILEQMEQQFADKTYLNLRKIDQILF